MCPLEVDVYLPKFRLEEKYKLNADLQSLGMTDAFERRKANFTGISEKMGLYVSNVTHKCFVEVNEEGSEAAAATGIQITPMSAHFPLEFKADHPFLFFIIHNAAAKSILFFGKYSSP